MDFYRDIRYLGYQNGEIYVSNVGSAKLLFRNNTGKVELYIKKIPCHYPVTCKLTVSENEKVMYTRWLEIANPDWQKSLEFSWRTSYENIGLSLLLEHNSKICEKKEPQREKIVPKVRMQQAAREEIEAVSFDELKGNTVGSEEEDSILEKAENNMPDGGFLSENEYYMSRISELSELSKELEPLEHNSFLLHGYFNYRHLLIRKEGESFLVGVPGNYYYREEMVAAMFGFPNFVPVREKKGDSCAEGGEKIVGEFGYYFA